MSANPIIKAVDVKKHYNKGTIRALDGVTASIEKGEVVNHSLGAKPKAKILEML